MYYHNSRVAYKLKVENHISIMANNHKNRISYRKHPENFRIWMFINLIHECLTRDLTTYHYFYFTDCIKYRRKLNFFR